MDCQHLIPADPCISNTRVARRNCGRAMMMVQIVALAVGRRRGFLVMVGQHVEKYEAAMCNLMIGWLCMSHRRRMNCSRKKCERKNQTGDKSQHS